MNRDVENVKHDQEGLSNYITLPYSSKDVSWEIATLPDTHAGGLPGPTDYVSLVALIHVDKQVQEELLKKAVALKTYGGFPDQLVRSWLPEPQRKILNRIANGESPQGIFDANFLVNKANPAEEAVGFIEDDVLLIYVGYISPK
jgi:hypothetical protein